MQSRIHPLRPVAITALALSLLAVPTPSGAADPPETPDPPTATRSPPSAPGVRSVTLVTGDRVIVTADGKHQTFVPRAGRRDLDARMLRDGKGHLHVIPRDAGRLIASGKLDPRLFDVTYLLENRYGDGQRDAVPLIVRHPAGKSQQESTALTALAKAGRCASFRVAGGSSRSAVRRPAPIGSRCVRRRRTPPATPSSRPSSAHTS